MLSLLLVPLATLGCSGAGAQTCVSWAVYEDVATRTEAADVVVEGLVLGEVGERRVFGVQPVGASG